MKPRLLITRKVFPEVVEILSAAFDVQANQDDELWDRATLLSKLGDKDALFVTASDSIDVHVLEAAARLRIVATGSVGYNHIDVKTCRERSIAVTNTPDVLTEATADMAWALLMAAARRVTESERWLRAGHWQRWAFDQFLGADLHRTQLGIVGMGRIGSAIARRARGFEMTVRYFNRSRAANEAELGASLTDLPTLLRESDHLVIVVPYSAATHHLIGAGELAMMKPTAVLVNIARGGIVDDRALAAALAQDRLGAAGLDVYEGEPAVAAELLAAPRIALTPHIGSATRNTRMAMAMLTARNLLAWADGKPLPTQVA